MKIQLTNKRNNYKFLTVIKYHTSDYLFETVTELVKMDMPNAPFIDSEDMKKYIKYELRRFAEHYIRKYVRLLEILTKVEIKCYKINTIEQNANLENITQLSFTYNPQDSNITL